LPLAMSSKKQKKGGGKKPHFLLLFLISCLCALLVGVQVVGYYGVQNFCDTVAGMFQTLAAADAASSNQFQEREQIALSSETVPLVSAEQPVAVQPTVPAAASSEAVHPVEQQPAALEVVPAPKQQPPGSVIRGVPEAGKRLALTFDDGPSPQYTPAYLEVLREHGVRATFFMVGRQVKSSPELAAMIAADGHDIGNHTFDHPNLRRVSNDTIQQQIQGTNDLLEQATGQQIRYFRPPGGNTNQNVTDIAAGKGLRVIMWNIDPRDWERGKTSDQIVNHILNNLQPGGIVVMHERKPQTLAALPVLINRLREQGWELVTVTELLSPPA